MEDFDNILLKKASYLLEVLIPLMFLQIQKTF